MLEEIFQNNYDFEPWTVQHALPVFLFLILGWWSIKSGRRSWSDDQKWRYPFLFSLTLPASILFWIAYRTATGQFDLSTDLPFHMCNFLTFFVPFIFLKKRHHLFFGIIYFWVLAGTFQAVITPGLDQAFPHFHYFRYWLIHCGLVVLVLYAVLVLEYRPTWKDIRNAFLAMNGLFLLAYAANILFDANYLYTMRKPETASLLDYLGPWPVYLLVSEVVALLFFILYFLPFLLQKSRT